MLCTPLACTGVELKNVKMSMNPFCENAMEEAIKLKVRPNNVQHLQQSSTLLKAASVRCST